MVRLVQNSFFGGQLDFEMMGRQDYQRYAKGATKLCNFNVMKRGGLDKRRGFDRVLRLDGLTIGGVATGITANTVFRAIPFAYTKSQGFVLLMSGVKCIVVTTIPRNEFKYYTISGIDGIYNNTQIQELDYQQCGDVLFLSHQDHRPAKITHYIDGNGEHGFYYETLSFSGRKAGIPSITGANIKRLAVADNEAAAQVTLKYKVSAVYDGEETLPCSEFYNTGVPEMHTAGDHKYDGTNWNSTTYRAPWTESQKVSLSIKVNGRTGANGAIEYPEEIRIYKKAFNYYGLIGNVLVAASTNLATSFTLKNRTGGTSATFTEHQNSGGTATNTVQILSEDDVNSFTKFAYNRKCFTWPYTTTTAGGVTKYTNSPIGMTHTGGQFNTGNTILKVMLGGVYYETISGGVRFVYTGYGAGLLRVAQANVSSNTYSEVSGKFTEVSFGSSAGRTVDVLQADGETAEDFASRWGGLLDEFVNEISASESVEIAVENGGKKHILVTPKKDASTAECDAPFTIGGIAMYTKKANVTSVTFDDTYITPDTSQTPYEENTDGSLETAGNYPASVSLSQQRLIWASSKNDPQRIWMSAVGDFYSYNVHDIMTADDPIDFNLPITRFATVNHIVEMRKLLLFNSACEWLVDSSSALQGLTYETIQAFPQSYSGSSARLKPIICNNSLIFCERTGQSVRRFAYDLSNDGFAGRDVSILSSSIFEFNSIVDWTYQQFPYSTLWCVMRDGTLASFEYMEEQDIMAWLTHRLGGNGKAVCVATSYAVSPAMDMIEDVNGRDYEYATSEEIFLVVRRTDDEGHDSLWLERMRPRTKVPTNNEEPLTDSLYHALCLDGCRVLNSTGNNPVPTDEKGAVWIPANTTTGAYITREEAIAEIALGHDVYEGFPFAAEFVSVFPNVGNGAVGNGQFDISHVQGCALRLMHSFGGKVRPIGSGESEPVVYFYNDPENDHRMTFDGMGNVTLHNHDTHMMSLPGVNNRDGRVSILQDDPYPFSLLSYEIDFETENGGGGR